MSECPTSWCVIELGEIADLIRGVSYKKEQAQDAPQPGLLPVLRATNITGASLTFNGLVFVPSENISNEQLLRHGDVVIASSSGSKDIVGKAGSFAGEKFKGSFGAFCTVLRPSNELSSDFFGYYFQTPSYRKSVSDLSSGSNINNLKSGDLASQRFPLPPLPEQTRIVEKLEELLSDLDAGVTELKAAQKKLAQYRQSLLKAAVEGALTAEWREARRNSPSPQPLSHQGRGAMATDVLNDTGMLTPLPPRGGGAGGGGAKARQVTSAIQQQHARELRSHQTPTERDLWQQLRAKRFAGFKFRRQQPLGRYIVDFVCFEQRLIVELDGSQHADQQDYDAERDAWLQAQGFRVLRFWNNQWSAQPEAVLEAIWLGLQQEPPLPNPSPARGEGLETGAQLLERILLERRARWEAKQLAKFAEQGKTPPKDWQKKYPEPVQPDITGLPELPEGWVWASIDQCSLDESAITDGPFGSNLKSSHYQEAGPRVIRLQNIGDGVFLDAKAYISRDHYEKLTKHAVEENDLVVAMLGEVLPRACVVPAGVSPAIVKADCARVRLNSNLALPHVLMSQLNSKLVRDFVLEFVKGIGRPRINLGHIRAIPMAICPMEEQLQIEKALIDAQSSIDDQLKAIEFSLKQSAAQRQNILKAAFSGQLVPQDPNDEPASVLLERIRAERAAQAAVNKPRGRRTKEISA